MEWSSEVQWSYKGRSQVLLMLASPHMEAKCANFWAWLLETFKVWFLSIRFGSWLCYAKQTHMTHVEVRSSLLLDPTLNISPKPHLQNVLPCRHPCQTRNLGLGTPCEVASPNFHALSGWDCADGQTLSDSRTHVNRPLVLHLFQMTTIRLQLT